MTKKGTPKLKNAKNAYRSEEIYGTKQAADNSTTAMQLKKNTTF